MYFCVHRTQRIQDFFYSPKDNWRVPAFDVLFFLVGAALFTTFIIQPTSVKEAFLSGATWEGAWAGLLTGKK